MTSDVLVQAGNEIRDNLVQTAVKFLSNPNIQRCTIESKERFLRNKGLTDMEIRKAIEKCTEVLDIPSMTSELLYFQRGRRSWLREHILPLIVYSSIAYGAYWFYKNCLRSVLFVDRPRPKTTRECLDELRLSMDALTASVSSLRADVQAARHAEDAHTLRSLMDGVKSDVASVKGILLNRNQFPSLPAREAAIPAWQRPAEPSPPHAAHQVPRRAHRSESGGSNSSEGEHAAKNSDSSLEIIT